MSLGMGELALILVIAFVVVGPRDLPKIARAVAKVLRQVKGLYAGVKDSLKLEDELAQVKQVVGSPPQAAGSLEDLAGIRHELSKLGTEKIT